jgi:hypothetical protein
MASGPSRAPLSKEGELRFRAETTVAEPFKLRWQVVNTGQEAQAKGDLRGGFYEGSEGPKGTIKKETTRHTGKHWVECFVIKDGVCVARSGEFIINVG